MPYGHIYREEADKRISRRKQICDITITKIDGEDGVFVMMDNDFDSFGHYHFDEYDEEKINNVIKDLKRQFSVRKIIDCIKGE